MHEVVAGHSTKADKIRALDGEGYSRVDIAKYLEIRYQHVRNVLVGPKPARTVRSDVTSSGERRSKAYVSLGPGGRIVIPATFRQALGIEDGDKLVMHLDRDELRVISVRASIKRAQDLVARYVPENVSLVDELIAERRREAAREDRGE